MKAKYHVIETEAETCVYDTDYPVAPIVFSSKNFMEAIEFCYHAGENFQVEILEQLLLDRELPFGDEDE